jgi:hypothetical protein
MAAFLKSADLSSEVAQLDALLARLPEDDLLGRIGLNSRRDELLAELAKTKEGNDTLASTALYFGGKPVIGNSAIKVDFAAEMVSEFKDLVVKLWATENSNEVGTRGPIHNQSAVELHITGLLHGSMGFLIEEVDPKGAPLVESPTKAAADKAASLIVAIADAKDEIFQSSIDVMQPRVFQSVSSFFRSLHRAEASVRVANRMGDFILDAAAVDRAYSRLEQTRVEEDEMVMDGLLIGIIPYGGRFEFQPTSGDLIAGKVAPTMSETFLQRLQDEQGIGKWFRARIRRRSVKRFGPPKDDYVLLDLTEVPHSGELTPDSERAIGA